MDFVGWPVRVLFAAGERGISKAVAPEMLLFGEAFRGMFMDAAHN